MAQAIVASKSRKKESAMSSAINGIGGMLFSSKARYAVQMFYVDARGERRLGIVDTFSDSHDAEDCFDLLSKSVSLGRARVIMTKRGTESDRPIIVKDTMQQVAA